MAKGKKAAKAAVVEKDESYMDFLGMAGERIGEEEEDKGGTPEPSQADQIAGLMKTIEGLATTVDTLQHQVSMGAQPAAQIVAAPTAPTLKEVSFKGLPDQTEDPEGFANQLNTRMTDTLRDNMRAMTEFETARTATANAGTQRTEQLWSDFQDQYMNKLDTDLPDGMTALPYVEVAAKNLATQAERRGVDLSAYMYRGTFMADVYKEAEKVLAPFRKGEGGGEGGESGPTPEEIEATRTGGIFGSSGVEGAGGGEKLDKSTLITDLQEVQLKTGFF